MIQIWVTKGWSCKKKGLVVVIHYREYRTYILNLYIQTLNSGGKLFIAQDSSMPIKAHIKLAYSSIPSREEVKYRASEFHGRSQEELCCCHWIILLRAGYCVGVGAWTLGLGLVRGDRRDRE